MVCQIIWSQLAIESYIANVEYLSAAWSDKDASNFISIVQKHLEVLRHHPKIGRLTNKRQHVRRFTINKRITLVYRYKPTSSNIELLRFWNNWQKM